MGGWSLSNWMTCLWSDSNFAGEPEWTEELLHFLHISLCWASTLPICYPPFSEVRKTHSFPFGVTLYTRVRSHIWNVWNFWKLLNKFSQFLVCGSAGVSQSRCTLHSTRAAVGMQSGQSLPSPLQDCRAGTSFKFWNEDKAFPGVSRMLFYLPYCWVYCWRNNPGPLPGPSLAFSHGVGSATTFKVIPGGIVIVVCQGDCPFIEAIMWQDRYRIEYNQKLFKNNAPP